MLSQKKFETIRSAILLNLGTNLSGDLFYHSVHHTIDVEMQAERIARCERGVSAEEMFLLKIACLYHDSGFLFTYSEHEAAGCEFVKKELTACGLSHAEMTIICGLIMATKIPQAPITKLEEIICDADLDYLGRDDFFPISNDLFSEFKAKGIVASENDWNLIQVKFFKQHHYFTTTTKNLREQKKQQHLKIIESMLVHA